LLKCPLGGTSELIREGCSELSVVGLVHRLVSTSRSLFEALQLRLYTLVLIAGTPYCWPIDVRFHAWRCSDGLQHPFGWVGVCRWRRASLTNKVVDKRLRVCTDVTEVDCTPACIHVSISMPMRDDHTNLWLKAKADRSVEIELLMAGGSCKALPGHFWRVW
jgi:hypothetical protein